ncbi:unnamed protein product [Caenorhabditis sp. 36 PRJEB53466]|nr:unnamed protein product [Caenorhabditis sp. 36 PRJEB53466]
MGEHKNESFMESKPEPTTSSFRGRYAKPKCAICHEDGDGLHFGADACRACTAFFRRTVALNKTYECRNDKNCEVSSNIRCICRSCRYDKCIDVGMKPELVQNRKDGATEENLEVARLNSSSAPLQSLSVAPIPQAPVATTATSQLFDFSFFQSRPSTSFSPFPLPGLVISPSLESMPLLERMKINYEKMESARTVIHRWEGDNIFQQKQPRALTFRQAAEVTTKEVSLVADWIEWCFDDFSVLPSDQKTILFQNFFIYFTMLERGYATFKSGRENVVVMASKDYVDIGNLEVFFGECLTDSSCTPEKLAKLIRPSFDLQQKSLFNLIRIENVDIYEFFALCVLLFWDFGLDGQSDECNEVGRKVKQRVTREMTFYLRHVKKHEEPLFRMTGVVSILPTLQRAVRRFQEDIEMAHLWNIYALPENFYNIVNGKFST